ncbi:hypothetical protein AAOGI_06840 [Agarivorans albus]
MAINPNNALSLRHVAYVADSGGGKTIAVKVLGFIPKNEPIAIFDPYGDYEGRGQAANIDGRITHHFYTRREFASAFLKAWQSGKNFVIAYKPKAGATPLESEWFANLMWLAGDGNRVLHIVAEELAKTSTSNGKATGRVGEIVTGGRKFGLVLHSVFQRPQEIPKTIWSNSPTKVIGAVEDKATAKYLQNSTDIPEADILALTVPNELDFNYWIKGKGVGNHKPKSIRLKRKGKQTTVETKSEHLKAYSLLNQVNT